MFFVIEPKQSFCLLGMPSCYGVKKNLAFFFKFVLKALGTTIETIAFCLFDRECLCTWKFEIPGPKNCQLFSEKGKEQVKKNFNVRFLPKPSGYQKFGLRTKFCCNCIEDHPFLRKRHFQSFELLNFFLQNTEFQ